MLMEGRCHVGGRQDEIPGDSCSFPERVLEVLIPHGVVLELAKWWGSSAVGVR